MLVASPSGRSGIVRPLEGFEKARAAWQAAQTEFERAVGRKAERTDLDALVATAAAPKGAPASSISSRPAPT